MRKWIVDAKKKVDAGDGEPVPQEDTFSHRLGVDKWDKRMFAPISSQRLSNKAKVREFK